MVHRGIDTAVLVVSDLESAFSVPTLATELLFEGHKSGFFLGNVTAQGDAGVKFSALGNQQYTLIRSTQSYGSYYHLWSGYEDGSFLGYYAKGQVEQAPTSVFGISYQSNINHSCPQYNVSSRCREFFTAKEATGAPDVSVHGAEYDCRERAWYYRTKDEQKTRWTYMYIDRATELPAFAICMPLVNLTADPNRIPKSLQSSAQTRGEGNTFIGVACTGFLISDISDRLRLTFPEEFSEKGVYIIEERTKKLVASSSKDTSDYYNATKNDRIPAIDSPNSLIAWSANLILTGQEDEVRVGMVKKLSANDAEVLTNFSVSKDDAFYLKVQDFAQYGIKWNLVIVQKAECRKGFEIDERTLVCIECQDKFTSLEGASGCNQCIEDHYYIDGTQSTSGNKSKCVICPSNMQCDGGTMLPYPIAGYWVTMKDYDKYESIICMPLCISACLFAKKLSCRSYCN